MQFVRWVEGRLERVTSKECKPRFPIDRDVVAICRACNQWPNTSRGTGKSSTESLSNWDDGVIIINSPKFVLRLHWKSVVCRRLEQLGSQYMTKDKIKAIALVIQNICHDEPLEVSGTGTWTSSGNGVMIISSFCSIPSMVNDWVDRSTGNEEPRWLVIFPREVASLSMKLKLKSPDRRNYTQYRYYNYNTGHQVSHLNLQLYSSSLNHFPHHYFSLDLKIQSQIDSLWYAFDLD